MSIYQEWLEAHEKLQEAKQEELLIRNAICDVWLEDVLEGSRTTHSEEYKITATARLNRTLDAEVLDSIWEDLSELERNAVEYVPKLKLSAYRELEAKGSMLCEAVTVKPGQASLKITVEDIE